MSVDFIRNRTGKEQLDLAMRQQEQLRYLTVSEIQKEINQEYLNKWAERHYIGNDHFLNWVKSIFRTENFLSFFKYFRHPLASARLINEKVRQPLQRVFHAENSYFKYDIKGESIEVPEELDIKSFESEIFDALLFRHNDIIIHDLKDVNEPYRFILPLKNVVAIQSRKGTIKKICYTAQMKVEDVTVKGYLYMDEEAYIFYNKDYDEISNIPHDLGVCPADYISQEAFGEDAVRKSIFTYAREILEEYVFLKTIQRMTEPNGAVPISIELDVKTKEKQGKDSDGPIPMSADSIGSQKSDHVSQTDKDNDNPLQAGTRIKVPQIRKNDGSIDTDAIQNFLNFIYVPTDALTYLKERIKEVENEILVTLLGDHSEAKEEAKNEMQVGKSYVQKQDKLRALSNELSAIRNKSDKKLLGLKYGIENVQVECFYGSDFFLETESDLYDLYSKSPNAIERKNILVRLSQNRNKFNPDKSKRERILYDLIPYSSDKDFDLALNRKVVDDSSFALQTRFSYYIGLFEAQFGNIVYFWDIMENLTESEKLGLINNLLNNLIKEDYEQREADRAS